MRMYSRRCANTMIYFLSPSPHDLFLLDQREEYIHTYLPQKPRLNSVWLDNLIADAKLGRSTLVDPTSCANLFKDSPRGHI
jgi:hypothetical protein